jgi:hypothetical protein
MKFYIEVFFENLSRKFEFHQNRTGIKGTLHYDQYTFSIISRSILLSLKHISDKRCSETRNTHFMVINTLSEIMPFKR